MTRSQRQTNEHCISIENRKRLLIIVLLQKSRRASTGRQWRFAINCRVFKDSLLFIFTFPEKTKLFKVKKVKKVKKVILFKN